MATAKEIAIRVRNLLSERSPAAANLTLPHIAALIPTAVDLWAADAIRTRGKRHYFLRTFSAALASGVFDLTAYTDGTTASIDPEDLRSSTVYTVSAGTRTPMTWVGSMAQLNAGRVLGADNPAIYLENLTLRTRSADGTLTGLGNAPIEFTVPDTPATADDIPEALIGDFVVYLADLAVKEMIVDKS